MIRERDNPRSSSEYAPWSGFIFSFLRWKDFSATVSLQIAYVYEFVLRIHHILGYG
jgi:hypothetical protein